MKKCLFAVLTGCILLSLSALGQAQTPQGTMRVHLDTMFLGYHFENAEYKEPDLFDGEEAETDTFSIELGKPQVGLGFGYAIIENLVIGGRLTMYVDATDQDNQDVEVNTLNWGVLPYAEYIFLTDKFRPFVMGQLGFLGARTSYDDGNDEADGSRWAFLIGAGGGAHFFLVPSFSLDAIVLLNYNVGTYEFESEDSDFGNYKQVINTFDFSTLVGLSGWF